MDYEVVCLKEKIVAGMTIRTSNNDPNMAKVIGEIWNQFFADGVYQSILNKKNDNSIGLYTNYEDEVKGTYDVMVCCEVSKEEGLSSEIEVKKIVESKYAKFVAKGHMEKAVAECWTKIWAMDLDRKYSFDFEEYVSGSKMDNAEINIYISIN